MDIFSAILALVSKILEDDTSSGFLYWQIGFLFIQFTIVFMIGPIMRLVFLIYTPIMMLILLAFNITNKLIFILFGRSINLIALFDNTRAKPIMRPPLYHSLADLVIREYNRDILSYFFYTSRSLGKWYRFREVYIKQSPSIIISTGILGTFYGIAEILPKFADATNTPTMRELVGEIDVAFYTSLTGIFLAIFATFFRNWHLHRQKHLPYQL